jgi:hypothetical protein
VDYLSLAVVLSVFKLIKTPPNRRFFYDRALRGNVRSGDGGRNPLEKINYQILRKIKKLYEKNKITKKTLSKFTK